MFYGNSVQDTRQLFFSSWQKHRLNQPLSALETQIVDVIVDHPEFHAMLETPVGNPEQSWFPELGQTNPFLHMGLHLAIRDQIATNRPEGITGVFKQLLHKHADIHTVEHRMMEVLAENLWQAQRNQGMVDEAVYLAACKTLPAT